MGTSKIEQLIEEIYEFVESCKMQPLSSTKVIVPKDELYDLLDELRLRTPDEIKRYQKIISNRDAIIADAEERSEAMLNEAREKTSALISEHEIMQQAYYQANEVVNQANEEANAIVAAASAEAEDIRTSALAYSEEKLQDVERILGQAHESVRARYDGFVHALQDNLNIVSNNRKELQDQLFGFDNEESLQEEHNFNENEYAAENLEDNQDYNFDENTFLEDVDHPL